MFGSRILNGKLSGSYSVSTLDEHALILPSLEIYDYLNGMQFKSSCPQRRGSKWHLSRTCIEDNHNVWVAAKNKGQQRLLWVKYYSHQKRKPQFTYTHVGSSWDNPGTPSWPSSMLITITPGTHDGPVLWKRILSWKDMTYYNSRTWEFHWFVETYPCLKRYDISPE